MFETESSWSSMPMSTGCSSSRSNARDPARQSGAISLAVHHDLIFGNRLARDIHIPTGTDACPRTLAYGVHMTAVASEPSEPSATHLTVTEISRTPPAALHDVSFDLERGQSCVLYSHDGSANAVLRAVIGVDPVDGGTSRLGSILLSRTATDPDRSNAAHVGLLLRDPVITVGRTVAEHIAQGLVAGTTDSHGLRVEQVAESLGFHGTENELVTELPVPLQYRMAIGRALIGKPAIIAADDPYRDVPARERDLLVALLSAVASEHQIGVLHATSDVDTAARGQRVLVIDQGRITQQLHGAREVQAFF